ncbi:hypothetical protein D3C78_1905380 [compost metagenome]
MSRSVPDVSSRVLTLRYRASLRRVPTLGVSATMGMSMLQRLIHNAVEPDSVRVAMAFTRR